MDLENAPSFLQGKRLIVIIVASVVGLFVVGGCITAIVMANSGGPKVESQDVSSPKNTDFGTKMFYTQVFDDVNQPDSVNPQVEGEPATGTGAAVGQPPATTSAGLQAQPDQPSVLDMANSQQLTGLVQNIQTEKPIFHIGKLAITKKRLIIIVVVAAVVLLAIAGGVTGLMLYRKKLEEDAAFAQAKADAEAAAAKAAQEAKKAEERAKLYTDKNPDDSDDHLDGTKLFVIIFLCLVFLLTIFLVILYFKNDCFRRALGGRN